MGDPAPGRRATRGARAEHLDQPGFEPGDANWGVKLSDNPVKAMGPAAETARYRRVFQVGEQISLPVAV